MDGKELWRVRHSVALPFTFHTRWLSLASIIARMLGEDRRCEAVRETAM